MMGVTAQVSDGSKGIAVYMKNTAALLKAEHKFLSGTPTKQTYAVQVNDSIFPVLTTPWL